MSDIDLKYGMTLDGHKIHAIPKRDSPSLLVLGNSEYEEGVHEQALCGNISDYVQCAAPRTADEWCTQCARKGVSQGIMRHSTAVAAKRRYDELRADGGGGD